MEPLLGGGRFRTSISSRGHALTNDAPCLNRRPNREVSIDITKLLALETVWDVSRPLPLSTRLMTAAAVAAAVAAIAAVPSAVAAAIAPAVAAAIAPAIPAAVAPAIPAAVAPAAPTA